MTGIKIRLKDLTQIRPTFELLRFSLVTFSGSVSQHFSVPVIGVLWWSLVYAIHH